MKHQPTVFIVDDDKAVCDGLALLLASVELSVEVFASASEFLDAYDPSRSGCLILDMRMPGMSGPELQKRLTERGMEIPIIFLSGHGDVATAVRALKDGAVDFLEKPFQEQALLDLVYQALEQDVDARRDRAAREMARERLGRLTDREREVLDHIVAGQANKVIAAELGLSEKTIEFHRSHLMKKSGAQSVAELVHLVLTAFPSTAL